MHAGDLDGARAAFEEAGRLDPKDPLAPETVAEIRLKQGDAAGARAAFEASLAAKDRALPHVSLGRLDLKEGKREAARARLGKALGALKGEDPVEVRDVAAFAVEVGALDSAEKLLSLLDADDGTPKDPGLYLELARLLATQLRIEPGAQKACEKARALLPKGDRTACPPRSFQTAPAGPGRGRREAARDSRVRPGQAGS